MEEQKLALPGPQPAPAAPAIKLEPPKQYALDKKDYLLLPVSLILGVLVVELFLAGLWHLGGLVVPVVVAAWYGVLFWYRGFEGLNRRPALLLLIAVCLLALHFAIWADTWFRLWNLLALPCLMGVQLFEMAGTARKPWHLPSMLWERLRLVLRGLFCTLGAPFQAAVSLKKNSSKRLLCVLLGLAASALLLLLVVPMLLSADALFAHVTSGFIGFLDGHAASWAGRLLAGLCFAPFLYGLLYALRRPEPLDEKAGEGKAYAVDAAAPATVLLVMDGLYVFFIAVQFAALFGGERYLAAADISYAEYARSGFFQLVAVAVLNLALVLACLQLCRRAGRGWRMVQVLSTALVAASCVMLFSAAYRMTLYVGAYGLSFKRVLTYWGMVMLAVFFAAALMKVWKQGFSFFKVLFAAGLAGWLVLNYLNVDGLVARYNVALYQRDPVASVDLHYLAYSSYSALAALEELPGSTLDGYSGHTLEELIAHRRVEAGLDASDWRTWSVSAQLAAAGGGG